jgi:hypothetical protein
VIVSASDAGDGPRYVLEETFVLPAHALLHPNG